MSKYTTWFLFLIVVVVSRAAVADPGPPATPSLGIGIGYEFTSDTDLASPNAASVRLVASPRLAFEGGLRLESRTDEFRGPDGPFNERTWHVGLNTRALFRVGRRGETDLHLVGVAGFAHDRTQHAAYRGKATSYSLGYGVEVQRWIGRRVAISLSAETTVLTSWRATQDGRGGGVFETTDLSLSWNPQVRLQLHFFF